MQARFVVALLSVAACTRAAALPRPQPAPTAATSPVTNPPAAEHPLAPVYSKALEGDMRAAVDLLDRIPPATLSAKDLRQRECLVRTFEGEGPPPPDRGADPFLADALAAYRAYWRALMLRQSDKPSAESLLRDRLGALLGAAPDGGAAPSLDDLVDALGVALTKRGYHSIRGMTLPYRELMVWKTQTSTKYEVALPDGPRSVEVVHLRDFASLGWSAFATCDAAYTGGWAEHDRLYCVADAYDLASEDFRVSYLSHETQHFADYERFPKLEQPELEYRAKLVELISSQRTTRDLVAQFAGQTGESRESPHNFANGRLTKDLERSLGVDAGGAWWTSTPEDTIRRAARALFDADTRKLAR